jgi:hypothetical protein
MRDGTGADGTSPPPALPLRAMTAGEVLDAAASLLRERAVPLLSVAAVLAAVEQVVLAVMREQAGLRAPTYLPSWDDDIGPWWVIVATGVTFETVVIALLGAYAGAAVGPALLGRRLPHAALWPRVRPGAVLVVAVVLAVLSWPAALFGFAPWLFLYGLWGLAVPVLTLDRVRGPFRALARSATLAARDGGRAFWLRMLGYLVWFAIRFALGVGWIAVATTFTSAVSGDWVAWAVPVAWGLANTVAYAALACLDAVLLVETRIRTEGLDIAMTRRPCWWRPGERVRRVGGVRAGRGATPGHAAVAVRPDGADRGAVVLVPRVAEVAAPLASVAGQGAAVAPAFPVPLETAPQAPAGRAARRGAGRAHRRDRGPGGTP